MTGLIPSFNQRYLILGGMALLMTALLYLAADTIINWMTWNDFLPRYIGCEAMLEQGENPYSEDVRSRIMAVNPPGNVEQRFSYPAHLCFVTLPFWLLPYEIGVRLWVVFAGFYAAGATAFMFTSWFGYQLRGVRLALMVFVLLMGFRYSIMTTVLAQFTSFVMFWALVAMYALWKERSWLAMVALASLSIRPDGFIVMIVIGLMALYRRQWQPVIKTIGIGLIMWAGTHLVIQGDDLWELQFINDIRDYTDYNTAVLYMPDSFGIIGSVMVAGFALVAAYLFWRIRHFEARSFYLAGGSMALLLPLIIIPQTNPYTLVYLIPGSLWLLYRHWQSRVAWAVWLIAMAVLPWPWPWYDETTLRMVFYLRFVYPVGLVLLIGLEILHIARQHPEAQQAQVAQPAEATSA